MMNHKLKSLSLGSCLLALAAASVTMFGCSGEEEAPPVVSQGPPPAPPAPPAPSVTPIEQLMIDLNIDRRVVLAEERAPDNDIDRKAVLVFFDALARGNSQALQGMMPLAEQMELAALVQSGEWSDTVSRIAKVEVQTGVNSLQQKCALAVVEVGTFADMTFQPQLWYYSADLKEATFEAAPSPPGILDRLSGDWIAAWHQILAAELAMADRPDEEFEMAQQNLEGGGSSSGSSDAPRGGSGGETAPGRLADPSTRPPYKAP